jgi:hypothetical protein
MGEEAARPSYDLPISVQALLVSIGLLFDASNRGINTICASFKQGLSICEQLYRSSRCIRDENE